MWDLSSSTSYQTCIPYIRRQILDHWTTREAPCPLLFISLLIRVIFFTEVRFWSQTILFLSFFFLLILLSLMTHLHCCPYVISPHPDFVLPFKIWGHTWKPEDTLHSSSLTNLSFDFYLPCTQLGDTEKKSKNCLASRSAHACWERDKE